MDIVEDMFFLFADDVIVFCYVVVWMLTVTEVLFEAIVREDWDFWRTFALFVDRILRTHMIFIKFWFTYVFLKFFFTTINREKRGPWQKIYIPLHDSDDEQFQRFLRQTKMRLMKNLTYGPNP